MKTKNNWMPYIALLLLLSGCGGGDSAESPAEDPAPAVVASDVVETAVPPPAPVVPPKDPDGDLDGIADAADNCLNIANAAQDDVDHDGAGDACDAVNDDTLDTDGDGVIDKKDAFPKDVTEWLDTDKDMVGDHSDNCPDVANADQMNTDQVLAKAGAVVVADGKGDVCDDDPDGDGRNAVYVDGQNGKDAGTGYYKSPVQSITQGMKLAEIRKASVWVAIGDYDVSQVLWVKGMKFYGGYTSSFDPKERMARTGWDEKKSTRLLAPGKSGVLVLQNLSTDVTFDAFMIDADAVSSETSAAIVVDNSVVTLTHCTVRGNALAKDSTALKLQNKAFATLDGNTLYPFGTPKGINSRGLWATNSTLTARNNIIMGGKALHAFGVLLESSTAILSNNTIDAVTNTTTQEFSTGVLVGLTTSPKLLNNLIMVHGNQAEGIEFEQGIRSSEGIAIKYNLIYSDGDPVPLLRDWVGRSYTFIAGAGDFQKPTPDGPVLFSTFLSPGSVVGNKTHTGKTLDLVTPDDYKPLSPSPVIDAGMDTSDPGNGGVITDWWGIDRSKWGGGVYDIGAREGS